MQVYVADGQSPRDRAAADEDQIGFGPVLPEPARLTMMNRQGGRQYLLAAHETRHRSPPTSKATSASWPMHISGRAAFTGVGEPRAVLLPGWGPRRLPGGSKTTRASRGLAEGHASLPWLVASPDRSPGRTSMVSDSEDDKPAVAVDGLSAAWGRW